MPFFIVVMDEFPDKVKMTKEFSWHVNHPKPKFPLLKDRYVSIVILFQADGHELDFITNNFMNLPACIGPICTWRGEMAQFIYDNL